MVSVSTFTSSICPKHIAVSPTSIVTWIESWITTIAESSTTGLELQLYGDRNLIHTVLSAPAVGNGNAFTYTCPVVALAGIVTVPVNSW
ncbi:hypothetical protein D3C87_1977630 [compost metagenome]